MARQYLQGQAHGNARAYGDFLSFMSVGNVLKVITEGLPDIPEDRHDLLFYYLIPALRHAAGTARDQEAVEDFITAHVPG